jgi:hypothetical protein
MSANNLDFWDTPNPTERGFVITAKEDNLADTIPDFLNTVVLWSSCPAWVKRAFEVRGDFQTYRLVHAVKAGFQQRSFYFAKVRTDTERSTHFAESWVKRPFSWPTVLLKLWAEEGRIPLSAVDSAGKIFSEPSKLVRSRYKPGGMYPTWFRIRHYLSEKPFPRSQSQRIPITDAIHWEFDGMRGGFPECLHPGVTVPNDSTTGAVVFGFGTPSVPVGGDIVQQSYPPTNFKDWPDRYVLEDDRRQVMGMLMEHRVKVEVFAPYEYRPPNLATA